MHLRQLNEAVLVVFFALFLAAVHCQEVERIAVSDETVAKLSCRSGGRPISTSNWTRNGLVLQAQDRLQFLHNEGILRISNLTIQDEAVYGCCDTAGRCSSQEFLLYGRSAEL